MKTYRRIAAVKAAAQILRFLADQREPVSGKEIATALAVNYNTAMCHITTLVDERFIDTPPGGGDTYKLGEGIAILWSRKCANLKYERNKIDETLTALEVK